MFIFLSTCFSCHFFLSHSVTSVSLEATKRRCSGPVRDCGSVHLSSKSPVVRAPVPRSAPRASPHEATDASGVSVGWMGPTLPPQMSSYGLKKVRRSSSCSNAHTAHSSGPKPPFGPLPEGETWQRSPDTPPVRRYVWLTGHEEACQKPPAPCPPYGFGARLVAIPLRADRARAPHAHGGCSLGVDSGVSVDDRGRPLFV